MPSLTSDEPSVRLSAVKSPRFLPWLLVLFIGSGCAALIYEIVWFQLLQLVIGLTNVSLGLLLGTFMGGMCVGSLLLPRFISPRQHPLRVYAFLELGIGVIGILILFLVPWISEIYTAHSGRGLGGVLLRGVVAALCLLPPTVLMGATLPAMARWIETTREGVSWLGFFYGGNIVGAVFGCLLAGFYLLRVHDMATATYVAASLNFAVAAVGFILANRTTHVANTTSVEINTRSEHPLTPSLSPSDGERVSAGRVRGILTAEDVVAEGPGVALQLIPNTWRVYVAIALSGMTALGAEVVWTRSLSLLMGGTVYTFSIILAVFLVGLGIGSSVGSFLSRSTVRPLIALGGCQMLLIAAVAWTAYMIAHSLPYWPINPSLALSPWFNFQLDLARCLWAVLPAAILWGASFPLALATVASRGQDSGRLVSGVYAANTIGAILGAVLFSLVVVPMAGTQWAQRSLIGLSALAALFIFVPLLGQRRSEPGEAVVEGGTGWVILILAVLGLAAILIWTVSPAPWGMVAYGRFMATYGNRLAPGIVEEKDVPSGGGTPDIFCTYMGEGLNGTVAVTRWTSGVRNFHSAGKVQASSDPRDMRLQRMLGHISALAHNKPESVLVVACGAGVTAGSFVVHPELKRIVICDIEPLVPTVVAPLFEKENYGVVKDLRTEVVLDDGRHFIRTTKEKFDIITSDPIDPWVKGCAALNTVEYYEMCKAHLKPGGIMSLWIPLYESNSTTVKSAISTFFKVFPDGILWSNDTEEGGYDAVLFGQAGPTQIDVDKLQDRLDRDDHALIKKSLSEVGFPSAVSLLATYAGRATDLQEWMRDAQINTDRNLRLQYLAGMSLNSYVGPEILAEITQYYKFPDSLFLGSDHRKQLLKAHLRGTSAVTRKEPAQAGSAPNLAPGRLGLAKEEDKASAVK